MDAKVCVRLRVPRGEEVEVWLAGRERASALFEYVSEAEGLELSTVKIVGKKGKRVTGTELIESLDVSSRLLVMGTSREAVAAVQAARSDPSLRTMEAEDEREARRRAITGTSAAQNSAWKFRKFQVCERFDGSSGPHYLEALRLLHRLASDANFLLVRYRWNVGALVEMDPRDDSYLKKREADGGCLLGYNENAGARIYIRLRTEGDALREYDELAQTLLHELCHNVVGPHNAAFFALYADLRRAFLDRHRKPTDDRVATLTSTRQVDSKGRVENELAREAGNSAISHGERASAALVASALHNMPDPEPEPTRNADKALVAAAAERRASRQSDRTPEGPQQSSSHHDHHHREKVRRAAERLRTLSPADDRQRAAETLLTILDNSADPKFRRIRLANKKFLRTAGKFPAALDLLAAVGFERQSSASDETSADDALLLTRLDPDLLALARHELQNL